MITALVATRIALAVASELAAPSPLVAIKIAPENDRVNPLPLSASDAAKRFGQLTPAQVSAVSSASEQLFSTLHAGTDAAWNGPRLYLSHSLIRDYREASIAALRRELAEGTVTLFDPYSLGNRAGETDAVIMAKIVPAGGGSEKWTAIAFVLKGDVVQRIVVAPQPWIRLMDR